MTHICVSKLTIIGSNNGLSPGRRQASIWTNARLSVIRTLGINFSEILSEIHIFSLKKMHLKMSSAKWRQFCLGFIVLIWEVRTARVYVYRLYWSTWDTIVMAFFMALNAVFTLETLTMRGIYLVTLSYPCKQTQCCCENDGLPHWNQG